MSQIALEKRMNEIRRLEGVNAELLEALRKIHRRAEDCHLGREVVESDSFHFHEIMVEADDAIKAAKGDA